MTRVHVRLAAAAALACLALAPFVLSPFSVTLMNYIGIYSLVAIGLALLTGVGGLTSFGQAAFCGFGAYTTAVLTTAYGVSPWLTLPASLVVSGIAAVLLGLVTVRLSGHYLPLGTIAWGIGLFYLFSKLEFLGRNDGISGIPPLSIGAFKMLSPDTIYYAIWIAVLLAALLTMNLLDSRTGRAIRALRRGHVAAEAFGVQTPRAKLLVFIYAAVLAGLSGWLYAHFQRAANPTPFGAQAGIEYLFIAVVGGAGGGLEALGTPVHETHRQARLCHHAVHVFVGQPPGDVVDEVHAGLRRGERRGGAHRVHGGADALVVQKAHHGAHPLGLDVRGHAGGAGTGRLGADVDDVRAGGDQLARVRQRRARVEVAPAVGERVRGDVEDAHDRSAARGGKLRKCRGHA